MFYEEWIKFAQDTSLIYREYLSEILLLLETNFLYFIIIRKSTAK